MSEIVLLLLGAGGAGIIALVLRLIGNKGPAPTPPKKTAGDIIKELDDAYEKTHEEAKRANRSATKEDLIAEFNKRMMQGGNDE